MIATTIILLRNTTWKCGKIERLIVGNRITVGGDIIIAVNGTRITGIDDLSAYLEEYTLPEQTVELTIVRDNQMRTVALVLESRPTTTTT